MTLGDIQIAGCAILQDRKEQVIPNIKQVYPYVDYFTLINGGNTDGWVEEILEHDYSKNKKIHIIDFPWCDNFPLSRQQYLTHAGRFRDTIHHDVLWICRFDADEYISQAFLERMRKLILYAEQNHFDMLGIRAFDITVDREGNEVSSHMGDFHKGLVYKWNKNLQYVGARGGKLHETYNHNFRMFKVPSCEDKYGIDGALCYKHIKQKGDVWERAQRNIWVDGGGDNLADINKGALELKEIMTAIFGRELENYHEYINYLKQGNVNQRLKDWFIKYGMEGIKDRDFKKYPKSKTEIYFENNYHLNGTGKKGLDYPGSSEMREAAKYYYDWLHVKEVLDLPEDIVMDFPLEQETKEYYKNAKIQK